MTTAGTISVGVEIVGHDLAEKLAAQIRKDLAPQIAKINKDLQRQYAKTDRAAEKSAATQVSAARTVTHAVGEIGDEHEKTAAKAAAAAKLQSREIKLVTRDIEKQTAALSANTAARAANAAAPTGGPPSGGGGGSRGGSSFGGGGGGRGGIGGFLTGPVGLNGIALGASALPAATLAVTNLAGAVQQLGQAGLAIPGVMAGIASSVGTAVLGFHGMSDAVKALNSGDLKKATEALKDMDPAAQDVARSVSKLSTGPLRDLQKSVQGRMFAGISTEIEDLAAKRMPNLSRGLGGIADAWNATFKEIGRVGGSDSTGSILDRIFGNTAEGQKRANAAIEPLVKGFGTLAAAGTDVLPRLGDALTGVATRFSNFITSADQDGRLSKWIDQGLTAVGHLGESFLSVGKIITSLTQAANGDGGFLKFLDEGTKKLAAFLGSDEGQAKLTAFFSDARQRLSEWIPILGNVAQTVGDVFRGFQSFGDMVLPVVRGVTDALSGMGGLVTPVVTAFLAFKTFSGLASLLGSLTTLGGLLDGLGGKAAGAGKGVIAGLNPAAAAITAALVGLNELNNKVSPQLKDAKLPDIAPPNLPWYKQAWNVFQSWIPGSQFQPPGPPPISLGGGANAQRERRGMAPIIPQLPQTTPFDPNPLPIGVAPGTDTGLQQITGQADAARKAVAAVGDAVRTLPTGEVRLQDNTPEVIQKLTDVGLKVTQLPDGQIAVTADTSQADKALSDFRARAAQGVTVPIQSFPGFSGQAHGSATTGRADGGVFPGYAPGVDSILSWVSPGEGVLIPEAVRGLGGPAGVFALNSRFRGGLSKRGYADGGVAGSVPSGLSPMAADIASAMAQALGPLVDLLTSIRDAVGGKAGGPLADTAASTGRIAQSVGATTDKPYGGDVGKAALAGAVKALGGDPAQLFDGAFDASGKPLMTGGSILGGADNSVAASLAAFAKSGNTADLSGTGLNAGSPVVSAIVSARNKKKGGLSDDDIAGLVSQIVGGGGFTGVLDSSNSALVKSLTSYSNKGARSATGAAGSAGAAGAAGALGGLGSNPLGYSGSGPVPVYIVDGPGAGGIGAQIGGDLANSALQSGGQVLSNVSGDLIDGLNKATQLEKNSTLNKPAASTESLLKGGNPAGVASLLGYKVPDFSRRGGDPAAVMSNSGSGFTANGQIFSDTAALIQRSFTDMEAANQARHEQMMAVLDGIKTQLSESVLKPIIQSAVQAAMSAAGSAAQGAAGGSAIPGLARGGGIWGGVPGRDSVPAMLMPGEHVLTTTDVARLGGQPGVYAFRSALARTGGVRGFATGGGVSGNDTVGADFFGVSQIPIIGAIINLIVKTLLEVIGVNIEVADTLNEISDNFRKFRGDFKAFQADGRLMNDTSGLVDRTGSSEQKAIDERVRIFKQVLTGLIKYIIQKIIIPITQAVLQTLLSSASSAASGAISGGLGMVAGPAGPIAGNLVGGLINSAGGAAINIGGELISNIAGAAVGPIISLFTDGFMGAFGKLLAPVLSGGIGGFLSMLFPFLAFDNGGVAAGMGLLPKATMEPERVLSPRQTSAFEDMVRANFGSSSTKSVQVGDIHLHHTEATPEVVRDRLLALLS